MSGLSDARPAPAMWSTDCMVAVTLRRVEGSLLHGVLGLRVRPQQRDLVASVEQSFAQVAAHAAQSAFAVFDAGQRGLENRPSLSSASLSRRCEAAWGSSCGCWWMRRTSAAGTVGHFFTSC
jgi:hypothetical protein